MCTGDTVCTNPTSDKGCSIWAMIGSAMATAPWQMTLYSCRGSTGFSTVVQPLYLCGPRVGTHSLVQRFYSSTALYSPLQPSTYSSAALHHPLTTSTVYNSSTALLTQYDTCCTVRYVLYSTTHTICEIRLWYQLAPAENIEYDTR